MAPSTTWRRDRWRCLRDDDGVVEWFWVLEYKRSPMAYQTALDNSSDLQACCTQLQAAGEGSANAHGAKWYLEPWAAQAVRAYLAEYGVVLGRQRVHLDDLRRRHIIVCRRFRSHVASVLADIPSKEGPR